MLPKDWSASGMNGIQGRCGVQAAGYCNSPGEVRAAWTRVAQGEGDSGGGHHWWWMGTWRMTAWFPAGASGWTVGSSTELDSSGADSVELIHSVLSLMCF